MSKLGKKPVERKDLGDNPYIACMKLVARKRLSRVLGKDNETVERKYLLEVQPCTKIWHDVDYRNVINSIDDVMAFKLFIHIVYTLNKDFVCINPTFCISKYNLRSRRNFDDAIKVLLKRAIITPTIVKDIYWVNPAMMFSGNRLDEYPDNIVEVK